MLNIILIMSIDLTLQFFFFFCISEPCLCFKTVRTASICLNTATSGYEHLHLLSGLSQRYLHQIYFSVLKNKIFSLNSVKMCNYSDLNKCLL